MDELFDCDSDSDSNERIVPCKQVFESISHQGNDSMDVDNETSERHGQFSPPNLVKICINTLVQYKQYLGDIGYLEVSVLRAILVHCNAQELFHVEEETKKGSHYDLTWYTWHIWQRLYSNLYGLSSCQTAELPSLPQDKPIDYVFPSGFDLREGDWKTLYLNRQEEMERRREAVKRRMDLTSQLDELDRQVKKHRCMEMTTRPLKSMRSRDPLTSLSASRQTSNSTWAKTLGTSSKNVSVMRSLGLLKESGSTGRGSIVHNLAGGGHNSSSTHRQHTLPMGSSQPNFANHSQVIPQSFPASVNRTSPSLSSITSSSASLPLRNCASAVSPNTALRTAPSYSNPNMNDNKNSSNSGNSSYVYPTRTINSSHIIHNNNNKQIHNDSGNRPLTLVERMQLSKGNVKSGGSNGRGNSNISDANRHLAIEAFKNSRKSHCNESTASVSAPSSRSLGNNSIGNANITTQGRGGANIVMGRRTEDGKRIVSDNKRR